MINVCVLFEKEVLSGQFWKRMSRIIPKFSSQLIRVTKDVIVDVREAYTCMKTT